MQQKREGRFSPSRSLVTNQGGGKVSEGLNEPEVTPEHDAEEPKDKSIRSGRPDARSAAEQAKDKEQEMEESGEELPG
jgi:hypothetical protein